MSSATAIVSNNVTLVPDAPEEDLGLQGCLDGSVAWRRVEVDDDELLGSEEVQQFVDFVLDDGGDSELELIQEVFEDASDGEIDLAGNENELCNGAKVAVWRKATYEGPKNNRRYNVAGSMGYRCGVCLLRFSVMSHLFRHLLLKHRQDEDDQKSRIERVYGRCRRCMKTFRSIPRLNEHLREVHKGTFFCGTCLRVFKDKASLNRHRKLHAGMNPYVCDVCDKECTNMSHLICHRRTHFTNTDPTYRCPHCDRAFSSSGNLKKHITRVHTLDKTHQCPKCPETFIYTRQLKSHLSKSHTPKTLCQDCNRTFLTPTHLQKHRQKHHLAQDRPHVCPQCSTRFKQSSHLTTHLRTHSDQKPFPCKLCRKSFLTGSDLRRHQQTRKCRANRG